MQIRNKNNTEETKIFQLIKDLFNKNNIVIKEDVVEAYLKKRENSDSYIKLYYKDNKIVLSEKYKDYNYDTLYNYIDSNIAHNPDKNLKDYTLEDLENLSSEVKEEMRHIWFAADFHQGHKAMAESIWDGINRPTNMDNHDDWLISQINSRVNKKDKFYLLGDISMRPRVEAERFIHKLNGHKTLIYGNHDKNIKNTNAISEKVDRKEFKFTRPGIEIFIVLDHYPMVTWNRKVHGAWHLYGHVHGRYDHPDLAMDVGIDNTLLNHAPINLYEVAEYMLSKKINKENEIDIKNNI